MREEAKSSDGKNLPHTSQKLARKSRPSRDDGYMLLFSQKYIKEKKKMKCEECGHGCCHGSHLEDHQTTHRAQRAYTCYECGKRFHKKFNLERHQNSHRAFILSVVTSKPVHRRKK